MKPLEFRNRFVEQLPGDKHTTNERRQVIQACYSKVHPRKPTNPELIHVADELRDQLGFTKADVDSPEFLALMSGKSVYSGTIPYAMCYGGHQFGHWAGQLGDGRAINLFQLLHQNQIFTLQLKGSGETPYSRSADGLAVLRSSIREHLCSEAMHYLGVPTTRSLALLRTGDEVLRDVMYDGNSEYEPGAIVCRVSESFLRFGNFQIFAGRGDEETLRTLIDYTIKHYFPAIKNHGNAAIVELFREVSRRTLNMVLHWQRVGFVHGVMNTDNMSILGQTIDYGPYGWLENYDPNWTPNTTDSEERRYRFGAQPEVAQWNLMQLANTFYFLTKEPKELEEILRDFATDYNQLYSKMMAQKLGLQNSSTQAETVIKELEQLMQRSEIDYTIFFRELSQDNYEFSYVLQRSSYRFDSLKETDHESWQCWFKIYSALIAGIAPKERSEKMKNRNPKYVLRNYMAQLAIEQAETGSYELIDELYTMLKQPYNEQPEYEKWYKRRPDWAKNKVGCSMLSCSS